MTAQDNPTAALGTGSETGPRRGSLGPIGQRLAHLLLGAEAKDSEPGGRRLAAWLRDERGAVGAGVLPRFPQAHHGYDRAAVDTYVADLERDVAELDRELAALRARVGSPDEVASELKRIGEQTSSVLIAAHEQQEEILRVARDQADQCIADAAARANALTAEAEARLGELEAKTEATQRERDRLLEDARSVSAAFAAIADGVQTPIPAQVAGG
jgi:DivIVA protein